MEWFFIEALVALAVGIAIVWWTMAPQRKLPAKVPTKLPTKPQTELPANLPNDNAAKSDAGSKVD